MQQKVSTVVRSIAVVLALSACASDSTTELSPRTELAVDDDATVPSSNPPRSSTVLAASSTTTETPSSTVPIQSIGLELELIATLTSPVAVAARPGSKDLYVVEQQGRIVRLPAGRSEAADVALDLRGSVSLGNEQGLLGLAFSADGERLYVDYTDTAGDTTIARYLMAGPLTDSSSAELLLTIPQPRGNHNGGQLAFGPDGFLYIGMGDGGGGGDPDRNGQNPDTLLGSILRIDVAGPTSYAIPSDNPFVDGAAPEVFIWGIRNAWRFGFDPATGDLWIGDVGQDRLEEVTVLRSTAGGGNGANLGWNEVEGGEPYRSGEIPVEHVTPLITYGHGGGRCSITGGEVYRGEAISALHGTYLFGDFCTGEVFGHRVESSDQTIDEPVQLDLSTVSGLSSFGVDSNGEMLVVSRQGGLYRIVRR